MDSINEIKIPKDQSVELELDMESGNFKISFDNKIISYTIIPNAKSIVPFISLRRKNDKIKLKVL